jgi:geranylgeranyl diphosphate synthase type I
MYLGAYLGTGDQERVEALRRCGRLVGLAFQVRDDVLGIWGDADVLGKATGADLRKQKRSFPVVYGLQHAKGQAGARLREIASGPPPDDDQVQEELRILEETGAREYAQAFAEERGDQAMVWARRAHLRTESQEELERLVHFVLTRQH